MVALIREFRQGQASWNFFKNDLGNHVSTPPEGLFNYLFMAKVATATLNILQVGLSDFAMFDQNGVEVDDPIFPYKVFFRYTNLLKEVIREGGGGGKEFLFE